MMTSTNAKTPTAPLTLADLNAMMAAVNPTVYGFVVSQQIYDGLAARIPQKFAGGNCFGSTPIVVDPELTGTDFEVAFTRNAWIGRLQKIGLNQQQPPVPK